VSRIAWKARKVVIVGAGAVGSTFAYALAQSGLADEIVIFDVYRELAEGQVLDLAHGLPFYPSVQIRVGETADYGDAQAIVITAGAKQRPGESRLDLLQRNAAIVESIVDDIVGQEAQGVVVVVSNPVDVLTDVALQRSGWDKGRVIGSGTVLDSARLRYLLSQHCDVDVRNVHAYILGEHGDSELAAWSMTHIAGMPIDEYCPICGKCNDWESERQALVEQVRRSAYHIIDYKGATYYAIGMALLRIVGAILRNQRSVLTVSTLLDGEYGLRDVCLSLPCIVAETGVVDVIEANLSPQEQRALAHSARILGNAIDQLRGQPSGGTS
jgi:L-lactate dehydrogenase